MKEKASSTARDASELIPSVVWPGLKVKYCAEELTPKNKNPYTRMPRNLFRGGEIGE